MRRIFAGLIFLGTLAGLGGCASQKQDDAEQVSTIPWNRPESWEGQGPMGGMMPGTQ
jgi:hypothetical protein